MIETNFNLNIAAWNANNLVIGQIVDNQFGEEVRRGWGTGGALAPKFDGVKKR